MNLMVLLTRSWKGISFRYGGFFFVVIVFPATSLLPWVWVFGAPSCGAGVFEGFFGWYFFHEFDGAPHLFIERDIIFDMAAFSFRQLFFDYCFSGYKSSPLGVGVWRPFLWCGFFWRLFRLLIFLSWIWWCSSPVHGKVYHLDIGGIFFLSFFSPAIFPPGCGCLAPLPVVWVFSTFFCYSFYENGALHLFIRKVYHEGMAVFLEAVNNCWALKNED